MNNELISFERAMDTARGLISEEGGFAEYDRGIAELLVDLYGVGRSMEEGRKIVLSLLRPQIVEVVDMTNTEAADMLNTLSDAIQNWDEPDEYLEALGMAESALRDFPTDEFAL